MSERDEKLRLDIERLKHLELLGDRRLKHLEERVNALHDTVRGILRYLQHHQAPAAPVLSGTFTFSGDSMNAVLVASIPSLRQDGSPLAATDIASITFQKATAGAPGSFSVLQTNTAAAGAGLSPDQITFTDASSVVGDIYACFVTDTKGSAGAESNDLVATAPAVPSPPSAPTLTGTFT